MAQCHKNIRKFRETYNLTKQECADIFGVAENTIGNYENEKKNMLIKSYVLVNLKQDDKYKDIPIEFFLGLTSSMEKENIELNKDLGLSDKSINKLNKIVKDDDNLRKRIKLFAINSLIENIDFDKLGQFLIFPNYENKNINSNDFYKLYSDYFQESYYHNTHEYIEKERDLNDYTLNKMILNLANNIRNSKNCISLFKRYIKEKNYIENMRYDYIDFDYTTDNKSNSNKKEKRILQDEQKEVIQLRKDEIGI